jgi:GntR family transcriptional regulator, transcriptional repressor for pyruvate dehydrogenase complex
MPFQKIEAERLSLAVVRQIEGLILRGILRAGERLPAERDLADRLGVSRPSLREAIAELSARGLVETRPGAGLYVAEVLGSAFSPALIALFADHPEAIFDVIAFRRDMEGLAAERAARFGTEADLAVIDSVFRRLEAALSRRDAEEEAELDSAFHMAIVESGHNVVLLHMMRSMYELLRRGVFYNRQMMFRSRTTRAMLLDQHRAINTGIQARDPEAARRAVEAHLDYVEATLDAQLRADRQAEVAQLRLDREMSRK